MTPDIRHQQVTRYITPLREGGSLPALAEADDGDICSGPIAGYPVEERFRWLTAAKSASLQTSRPHPGLTDDLDATFSRLYRELVL